jgi:two-component system, OmpR family, sensor histidine kinase KdpD
VAISAEKRPDPDQLLRQLDADEAHLHRAQLKVFLGYASGVGKSQRMLDEGRRRKERGEDVVIGALQLKRDAGLDPLVQFFEVIPPLIAIEGKEAINVPGILKRHPGVCLVDGLAQDNPKQARNRKRYQDVQELLAAGISVLTSINLQYIEELRPGVERITGKHVTETVPKSFLLSADEIEVVDVPAEQVLERIGRQPDEQSAVAERRRLSQLRELALLVAAEVVDHQLAAYLKDHGIDQVFLTQERVLICLTPRAAFRTMIDIGERYVRRFSGELYVVYVQQTSLSAKDKSTLDTQLAYARQAGAKVEVLASQDPMEGIIRFARERSITQIFIGHSLRQTWWSRLFGNPVDYLIREAEDFDICVFPH